MRHKWVSMVTKSCPAAGRRLDDGLGDGAALATVGDGRAAGRRRGQWGAVAWMAAPRGIMQRKCMSSQY